MAKYYANMYVSNGTRYINYITDSNKERIIKRVRNGANGNRPAGGECTWYVCKESGECVAVGYTLANGQRCRVYGNDLRNYDDE